MNILIIADLEGISGVGSIEDLEPSTEAFRRSCGRMVEDINAAVTGAFECGASRVTVLVWHSVGGNVTAEMLNPRVEMVQSRIKDARTIVKSGYDGAFFIGAHAMAGTVNGFVDHTRNVREWHDFSIDGQKYGEIGILAVLLGDLNIPLILVTGDEAACVEARAYGNPMETVSVKRGLGWDRAQLVPEDEARKMIHSGAVRAMSHIGVTRPFKLHYPLEIRLELNRADFCERLLAGNPVLERVDARIIRTLAHEAWDILL